MTDTGALNQRFSEAFVGTLAASGLRHAVVCPGSRSTPLALALLRDPLVRVWMHVDERSAGFFALGMARRLGEPVALLCSSGTAAANFLPAVIEANLSQIPLLVLTADRPPELRDVGAAQTVDQVRIYGSNVRWFVDLPLPDDAESVLRHAAQTAARAMAIAASAPMGPVHVNAPFREPLVPAFVRDGVHAEPMSVRALITALPATLQPSDAAITGAAETMRCAERGIIVCGPQTEAGFAVRVARLAEVTGFPVLADPLSQVRCGHHDLGHVIDAYDAFLRDRETADSLLPDVVVRFGAIPTSKPLNQFLDRLVDVPQVLVTPNGVWRDPLFRSSQVIAGAPVDVAAALADALRGHGADGEWLATWRRLNERTRDALSQALPESERFEGDVFRLLPNLLPDGGAIVVGNSMPVRDLDTFLPATPTTLNIVCNRGANGIDGVVSTALGVAAANDGPTVLVIGDLSFFHDMNGLLAARLHDLNLTVLVVNNNGGGIFSFLPQASVVDPEAFETLFGTPIDLDVARVAALYGAEFARPEDALDLAEALRLGIGRRGLTIIEYATNREANVRQHRDCWSAVGEVLRQVPDAVVG